MQLHRAERPSVDWQIPPHFYRVAQFPGAESTSSNLFCGFELFETTTNKLPQIKLEISLVSTRIKHTN